MTTVQLTLPDDLKALAETRAAETGHANVQEYMAALIRADAGQETDAELEQLLLRRLDTGGPDVEFTHEFAQRFREQIQQRRSGER